MCKGLVSTSEEPVVLVTKDILLRIKAQLIGINAEDFITEQVVEHEVQYKGREEVFVPEECFSRPHPGLNEVVSACQEIIPSMEQLAEQSRVK